MVPAAGFKRFYWDRNEVQARGLRCTAATNGSTCHIQERKCSYPSTTMAGENDLIARLIVRKAFLCYSAMHCYRPYYILSFPVLLKQPLHEAYCYFINRTYHPLSWMCKINALKHNTEIRSKISVTIFASSRMYIPHLNGTRPQWQIAIRSARARPPPSAPRPVTVKQHWVI